MPTQSVEGKLATLPTKPGCYLHKDKNGTVIYVGKAINLRQKHPNALLCALRIGHEAVDGFGGGPKRVKQ